MHKTIALALLVCIDYRLCTESSNLNGHWCGDVAFGPVWQFGRYQARCKNPANKLSALLLSFATPVVQGARPWLQTGHHPGRTLSRDRVTSTMFMEHEEEQEKLAVRVPTVLLRKLKRKRYRLRLEPSGLKPIKKRRRFHRFLREDDPALMRHPAVVGTIGCATPMEFIGTTREGFYRGSYQLQFTLPGKEDEPKTIEVLRTFQDDHICFGAVRLKLPLGIRVKSYNSRMLVTSVKPGSRAYKAQILVGDIIRGASLPNKMFARSSKRRYLYDSIEDGMLILDGRSSSTWKDLIYENVRAHGKRKAELVIIVERLLKLNPASIKLALPPSDWMSRDMSKRRLKEQPLSVEVLPPAEKVSSLVPSRVQHGDNIRVLKKIDELDDTKGIMKGRTYDAIITDTAGIEKLAQEEQRNRKYVKALHLVNKMMRAADAKKSAGDQTPSFGELVRQIDKTEEENELYLFHLSSLFRVRQLHDEAYHTKLFRSPGEMEELEGFPSFDLIECAHGKLDGDLRMKGPDGKNFVARILDAKKPKSSYLQHLSTHFTEGDLLTKLDCAIESIQASGVAEAQDKDLQAALGLNVSDELDVHDKTLVKLGMQVIKRRRLEGLNVTAHMLWDRLVAHTDEIYRIAEQLLPAFKSVMLDLLHSAGLDETSLLLGPMKDPVRIYEKAADDYSTGKWDLADGVIAESWVRDVLRCGIVAESSQAIITLQKWLSQSAGLQFGGPGNTSLRLLRSKNKFKNPGPTHFRYILNNLELVHGNLSIVCEVQVHHGQIFLLDGQLDSHHHYDFFRAAILKKDKDTLSDSGSSGSVWDHSRDWDTEIEERLQAYEVSLKIMSHYGSAFSVQVDELIVDPNPPGPDALNSDTSPRAS